MIPWSSSILVTIRPSSKCTEAPGNLNNNTTNNITIRQELTERSKLVRYRNAAKAIVSRTQSLFRNLDTQTIKEKVRNAGFPPQGGGGRPPQAVCLPLRDFCPRKIWSENNRKICITKEICITIDIPPEKFMEESQNEQLLCTILPKKRKSVSRNAAL